MHITKDFEKVAFDCISEGRIFFIANKDHNLQNSTMCISIVPQMAILDNGYPEKVNYYNIQGHKFGFLDKFEIIEVPTKNSFF